MESALRIKIEADKAKKELKSLTGGLNAAEKAGIKASGGAAKMGHASNEMARHMATGTTAVKAMTASVKALLAPLLAVYSITGTLNIIKDAQQANALLRRAAEATVGFGNAQLYVEETAMRMSLGINEARRGYAQLLIQQEAGKLSADQARSIFEGLADAQKATGASSAQLEQAFFGLSQSLDVLNAENLNQFVEPLPGLMTKVADAAKEMGVTVEGTWTEFKEAAAQGAVSQEQFAAIAVKALENYKGAAEELSGGFAAMTTRMMNAWKLLVELLETPISSVITPLIEGITAGLTAIRGMIQSPSLAGAWGVVVESWADNLSWFVNAAEQTMIAVEGVILSFIQATGVDFAGLAEVVSDVFLLFPDYAYAAFTSVIAAVDQGINTINNLWSNLVAVVSHVFELIPLYAQQGALGMQKFFAMAFDGIVSMFSSMLTAVAKGMHSLAQEMVSADFVPEGIKQGMLGITRSVTEAAIAVDGFGNSAAAVKDRMLDVGGHIYDVEASMQSLITSNNNAAESYAAMSQSATDAAWAQVDARKQALDAALSEEKAVKGVSKAVEETTKSIEEGGKAQAELSKSAGQAGAALEKSAGSHKKAAEAAKTNAGAIDEYIEALRYENELLQLDDSARAQRVALMEAEAIAAKNNISLTEEQIETIKALAAENENLQAATQTTIEGNADLTESYEELAGTLQTGFSDLFMDIFENGKDAFSNLFDSIKQWFFKMIADMLAYSIANPIMVSMGMDGGMQGGLMGAMSGGSNPIMGLLGGLFGGGDSGGESGGGLLGGLFGGESGFNPLSMVSNAFGGIGSMLSNIPIVGDLVGGIGSAVGGIFGSGGGGALGGLLGGGGILGAAMPILGGIMMISQLFGGLFGGQEHVDSGLHLGFNPDNPDPEQTFVGWTYDEFEGKGLFGKDSTKYNEFDKETQKSIALAFNQSVEDITELAEKWGVEQARAFVDGMHIVEDISVGKDATEEEFQAALEEWINSIMARIAETAFSGSAFEGAFAEVAGNSDKFQELLASLAVMTEYMDADIVADFHGALAELDQTLGDQLIGNAQALQQAIGDFDGSADSIVKIGSLVQERYQLELQMLAQITAAIQSINQTTENSVNAIEESTMSERERYEMLTAEAESLAASLDGMTDPEEIARTVAEINQLTTESWQVLLRNHEEFGVSAEMLAGMQAQFIQFLEEVNALAQGLLLNLEQEAIDDHAATADELASLNGQSADNMLKAGEAQIEAGMQMQQAADKMVVGGEVVADAGNQISAGAAQINQAAGELRQAAANIPRSFDIDVDVDNGGGNL